MINAILTIIIDANSVLYASRRASIPGSVDRNTLETRIISARNRLRVIAKGQVASFSVGAQ